MKPLKYKKKFSDLYDWFNFIFEQSGNKDIQKEFNMLMLILNSMEDYEFEYNSGILKEFIELAFEKENYLFLNIVKKYDDKMELNLV